MTSPHNGFYYFFLIKIQNLILNTFQLNNQAYTA